MDLYIVAGAVVIALCVFAFLPISWFFISYQNSKMALSYTNAYCDSGKAIREWLEQNPNVSIGSCLEGRTLIDNEINAYNMFLKTHPFIIDDGKYRQSLLGALNYPNEG
jgi:hypothetical protein